MDPYSILGIQPTENWDLIKKAYKKMASETHPDKMGHARYFMMVHEAYQDLEKVYSVKKKVKHRENIEDVVGSGGKKPCSEENFNEYYESNEIRQSNPFESGYRKYMSKSKVREDVEELVNAKVKKPEKRIIVTHEPDAATTHKQWLDQVGLLGVEQIDDFSCTSGTDYMLAYQDAEEVKEKHKYYNSIDELEHERSNMSMELSREERRKKEFIEKERLKKEQRRRQILKKNDNDTYELYRQIHQLLR